MTPAPHIDASGVPRCSTSCPSWRGSWCVLAGRWTHAQAVCPVVRVMTEDKAAMVAAEDDAVRSRRREMARRAGEE